MAHYFGGGPHVTYARTCEATEVSASDPAAFESGKRTSRWTSAIGQVDVKGRDPAVCLAQNDLDHRCAVMDAAAEVFVPLECSGAACDGRS